MTDLAHLAMTAERERCRRLVLQRAQFLRQRADIMEGDEPDEAWALGLAAEQLEKLAQLIAEGAYA